MAIAGQNFVGFLDWKIRVMDLKENIRGLESREMDYMLIYLSVMHDVCFQFGGLIAVSTLIGGLFREFNYFVGLGMILAYFLYNAYPVYFGKKSMQALKSSSYEIIAERKRLYISCTRILSEYNNVCVVASPFRDSEGLLFKKIGDIEMKEFKAFKIENSDFIYRTKYYQQCLLLASIGGLVYLGAFISVFYVLFQV